MFTPFSIDSTTRLTVSLYPADGDFCSCGAPQMETTRPRSPEPAVSDRMFTVNARIIQATEAQPKIKIMAAIRFSMPLALHNVLYNVKYYLLQCKRGPLS